MADSLKELSRRWFEEVWNQGREETIHELFADDCVGHGLGDAPLVGVRGFKPFHKLYREAFPDLHIEVDDVIEEGDISATRITVTGTHTSGALGIEATGKTVRFGGIVMTRWKDGKIVEGWNQIDIAGMLKQLGN